jgi:hypothetical protein
MSVREEIEYLCLVEATNKCLHGNWVRPWSNVNHNTQKNLLASVFTYTRGATIR